MVTVTGDLALLIRLQFTSCVIPSSKAVKKAEVPENTLRIECERLVKLVEAQGDIFSRSIQLHHHYNTIDGVVIGTLVAAVPGR